MSTVCTPEPSSAVMIQPLVKAPAAVGWNVTVWVNDCPALRIIPSGIVESAEKGLAAGGFDFVIVKSSPPRLLTLKTIARRCPTGTSPSCSSSDEIASCPGSPHVPESATLPFPAVVAIAIDPVKSPFDAGAKVATAITDSPCASVCPAVGNPVKRNGALGAATDVNVSGCDPELL